MGVGNGDVWGVLRKVMLEADGDDGAAGRLVDRGSVLWVFGVEVRGVMGGLEEVVLVLGLDVGVGVE